jgi:hypothetical protein
MFSNTCVGASSASANRHIAAIAIFLILLLAFSTHPASASGPQTITLTASDLYGTNTKTAALSLQVDFTSEVSSGPYQARGWTLKGAGTLASSGTNHANATYTAPATMPSNPSITVTGYLSSNPSVSTSYTFTLGYAVPALSSSSPAQVAAGVPTTVALTGSGFLPGVVILANNTPVATTYISSTSASAQVTAPAGSISDLQLQAKNPSPGNKVSGILPIAAWDIALTATDQDGTNTNTGRLSKTISIKAVPHAGSHSLISWKLQGAGSFATDGGNTAAGTYTAPTSMPANSLVTLTASMASYPVVTESYTFTLINPVPTLNSGTSPSQAIGGATTAVTLTGKNFISSTVILVNNTPVSTKYVSSTSVVAQVTAPYGSTSDLSIQAQNPSPGGGASNTIKMTTWEIQLNASDVDGTNTGTARLGLPVTFTTSASAGTHTQVAWSLHGAGSIVASGTNAADATYTPPAIMPANRTITVTAYMNSYPSVTTSYSFVLNNPVPTVLTTTPSELIPGETQSLELFGYGFVPGTAVTLNGATLPLTYSDFNDVTVQVPVAADANGRMTLQVQNPSPGGGAGASFTAKIASSTLGNGVTSASVIIQQSASPHHIDSTFNGLSYEKADIAGPSLSANNTSLVALFNLLGPGVIRSGGHSADQVVFKPNGGLTGNGSVITSADIDRVAGFLQATNWKMIYALNFSIGTPPLTKEPTSAQISAAAQAAAAEAAYVSAALGDRLLGFEIGNEPDLYQKNGMRPTGFAFSDYASQWQTFEDVISAAVPNAVFAAPVASSMYAHYPQSFVPAMGNEAGLITVHYYAGPGSQSNAIDLLLNPSGEYATNVNQLLTYTLPTLWQLGVSIPGGYRIAETNAFGDPGSPGDAFGTALWGVDFELENALNQSNGVNFHNSYPPIDTDPSSGDVLAVNPLYYGMKLVALAADATTLTTAVSAQQSTLSAYALAADDGSTHVVLNNKDTVNAVQTTVQFMQPIASGTSTFLSAPSVTSKNGVTLGGIPIQSDGTWSSPFAEPLTVSGGGATITLPPGSAVFIDALPVTTSIGIPYDGLCVGSSEASNAGAYIKQLTCNPSDPAQAFAFLPTADGKYRMRVQNSNLCLDWQTPPNSVVQTSCSQSSTQKWLLHLNSDKTYLVESGDGQYCLNVLNNSTSPQASMATWACNGNANENFSLSSPPAPALHTSSTTVKLSHNGLCMAIYAGTFKLGPYVVEHSCNKELSQSFAFASTNDGYYTIISNQTQLCVNATAQNSSVTQTTCSGLPSQKWRLKSLGSGAYDLVNYTTNNCLNIPGSSDVDNTSFTTSSCNGGSYQAVKFSAVP